MRCQNGQIFPFICVNILQYYKGLAQLVHFSLSKHLSITWDTPSRFASQLYIFFGMSNYADRRRECEAASRAGAGLGRMNFQTYDFIQLNFSSYIEIGSASINIIKQIAFVNN